MKSTTVFLRYAVVALILLAGAFYGFYQMTLTGNTNPQEMAHVEAYLTITGEVDEAVFQMAADLFALVESRQQDLGKLTGMLFQIEELKNEIPTDYENFKELEQRSRDLLETLRQMVLLVYQPAITTPEERNAQWKQHTEALNRLAESRTDVTIRLLEAEGLHYHLNTDGSLSYWAP